MWATSPWWARARGHNEQVGWDSRYLKAKQSPVLLAGSCREDCQQIAGSQDWLKAAQQRRGQGKSTVTGAGGQRETSVTAHRGKGLVSWGRRVQRSGATLPDAPGFGLQDHKCLLPSHSDLDLSSC